LQSSLYQGSNTSVPMARWPRHFETHQVTNRCDISDRISADVFVVEDWRRLPEPFGPIREIFLGARDVVNFAEQCFTIIVIVRQLAPAGLPGVPPRGTLALRA